jgi:hypothetical protein
MGKCSHQAGKLVATLHRFFSCPHLIVNRVKRLRRSHDTAESISSRDAISQMPRKTTLIGGTRIALAFDCPC